MIDQYEEDVDSGGNQGVLNNGCVCDSGCEACGRLAEAFEAIQGEPMICTCAVHCVESGYHERACCQQYTCECWCHEKAKELNLRRPDQTRYTEARKLGKPSGGI